MNAPVTVPKEFSRANEHAFRSYIEGEMAMFYRKEQDIIIPYGLKLGFNGTNGEQVNFSYDGAFKITIDGATVVTLATDADLTTLESTVAGNTAAIASEASTRASADTAIASSVTTLTATVAGNTSSISTNASAIATVDGKLTASYALTVDSNGRIASMKLLSDGTTSSVKFTASTFQVYNGSTDEAPFTVEGGVVKANKVLAGSVTASEINVSTLSAISANLGTITAGQINLTSGSYVVRHGAGFGASSDLVLWYGASSTAIGSATKTNGIFALATDGKLYYGGTEMGVDNSPPQLDDAEDFGNVTSAISDVEIASMSLSDLESDDLLRIGVAFPSGDTSIGSGGTTVVVWTLKSGTTTLTSGTVTVDSTGSPISNDSVYRVGVANFAPDTTPSTTLYLYARKQSGGASDCELTGTISAFIIRKKYLKAPTL